MKLYEYRVEQIQIELKSALKAKLKADNSRNNQEITDKLNNLGKEGWELSGVDGSWFYFKREN